MNFLLQKALPRGQKNREAHHTAKMTTKKLASMMLGHAAALRSTADSFLQQMHSTAEQLEALAKTLEAGQAAPKGAKGGEDGKKTKRKRGDPNLPKRPASAFFLFCSSRRADQPGTKLSPKLLTAEWTALSDESKLVRYCCPPLRPPHPPR